MDEKIEHFALVAKQGSKDGLEKLIEHIQDRIYNLSLRMLLYPSDAEDATQEILIKIITHLSDFKGKSRFSTWSYKIAVNYLLNIKKYKAREKNITFDLWEELAYRTDPTFDYQAVKEPTKTLFLQEVRVACTQGVLQCLEKNNRIAFILGEIFELSGEEAAGILGISQEAYRKRFSRAKDAVYRFMQKHCSLVSPDNHCRCSTLVGPDIRDKWIDPNNLQFAGKLQETEIISNITEGIKELTEFQRTMALFRSNPKYNAPDSMVAIIKEILDSKQLRILDH